MNKPSPIEQNEFFDVLDLFGFLWKSRRWIFIFGLIGILVSVGFTKIFYSPLSLVRIPLLVENSFDLDQGEIVQAINSLASVEEINAELSKGLPAIKNTVKKIEIKKDHQIYWLEIGTLNQDGQGLIDLKTIEIFEKKSMAIHQEEGEGTLSDRWVQSSAQFKPELKDQFLELERHQLLEEAPLKAKLFSMEAKLSKFIGPNSLSGYIESSENLGDSVLRMLSSSKNPLSESERQRVYNEYASILSSLKLVKRKYDTPIKELTIKIDESLKEYFLLLRSKNKNHIVIKAAKKTIEEFAIQKISRNWLLISSLGALIGALVGLALHKTKDFLLANKERIEKIMA